MKSVSRFSSGNSRRPDNDSTKNAFWAFFVVNSQKYYTIITVFFDIFTQKGKTMSKIILAADGLSHSECVLLATQIGNKINAIKIHDLYDRSGAKIVKELQSWSVKVWVDLKLNDIPETVTLRTKALVENGANIITVHALGEVEMMAKAVEAAKDYAKIYAVTILTSLSEQQIMQRFNQLPEQVVLDLALNANKAGVQGVVCSPKEVAILRSHPDLKNMQLIVPGIRSPGKDAHDQKRVGTPAQAIKDGANFLVIGRQITKAEDPKKALEEIEQEIS